jgi:hypothetical protein
MKSVSDVEVWESLCEDFGSANGTSQNNPPGIPLDAVEGNSVATLTSLDSKNDPDRLEKITAPSDVIVLDSESDSDEFCVEPGEVFDHRPIADDNGSSFDPDMNIDSLLEDITASSVMFNQNKEDDLPSEEERKWAEKLSHGNPEAENRLIRPITRKSRQSVPAVPAQYSSNLASFSRSGEMPSKLRKIAETQAIQKRLSAVVDPDTASFESTDGEVAAVRPKAKKPKLSTRTKMAMYFGTDSDSDVSLINRAMPIRSRRKSIAVDNCEHYRPEKPSKFQETAPWIDIFAKNPSVAMLPRIPKIANIPGPSNNTAAAPEAMANTLKTGKPQEPRLNTKKSSDVTTVTVTKTVTTTTKTDRKRKLQELAVKQTERRLSIDSNALNDQPGISKEASCSRKNKASIPKVGL